MKRKMNLVKEPDSSINVWLGHPLYQWVDAAALPDYSDRLRKQATAEAMGRLLSHGPGLSFRGVTYYPAGQYAEPGKAPLTALGPFWVVRIGQDVGDGHTAAFRVYLPAKWNGCFMGIAGGGTNNEIDWYTSGRFNVLSWPVALANGYACAVSDNDSGTRLNCDWGFKPDGTPELDHIGSWLGRALHETTVWGKAVTALAYGRAPEKAYLQGTSGGGRQVLTEGVCHPEDYDGLWADAPAIHQWDVVFASLWAVVVEENEKYVVPLEKYQAAYALARADQAIGERPFDEDDPDFQAYVNSLVGVRTTAGPITEKDVEIMVKTWQGPITRDGRRMGHSYGPAIRQWPLPFGNPLYGYFRRQPDGRLIVMPISEQILRWLTADPKLDIHDLSYADFEALWEKRHAHPEWDFVRSDLSAFAARGGKLIITQGTGDPVVPFVNTFAYVKDMAEHFESAEAMADACRLYRMPYAGHSILDWSGPAVSLADGMAGLTDWVERGEAPDTLPIQRYDFDHDMPLITGTSHYKNL